MPFIESPKIKYNGEENHQNQRKKIRWHQTIVARKSVFLWQKKGYLWCWHWTGWRSLPWRTGHAITWITTIRSSPWGTQAATWWRRTTMGASWRPMMAEISHKIVLLLWMTRRTWSIWGPAWVWLCLLLTLFGRLTSVGTIRWLRKCWLLRRLVITIWS